MDRHAFPSASSASIRWLAAMELLLHLREPHSSWPLSWLPPRRCCPAMQRTCKTCSTLGEKWMPFWIAQHRPCGAKTTTTRRSWSSRGDNERGAVAVLTVSRLLIITCYVPCSWSKYNIREYLADYPMTCTACRQFVRLLVLQGAHNQAKSSDLYVSVKRSLLDFDI